MCQMKLTEKEIQYLTDKLPKIYGTLAREYVLAKYDRYVSLDAIRSVKNGRYHDKEIIDALYHVAKTEVSRLADLKALKEEI